MLLKGRLNVNVYLPFCFLMSTFSAKLAMTIVVRPLVTPSAVPEMAGNLA